MWHILRAEPDATIALGFRREVSRDELRRASLSGEVETMLRSFPVKPGETYFVPAGTVHAIGGGIALCEIQQNNDVTYRLYDYGRPRELHLEQGMAVADLTEHPGATELPLKCPYFIAEELDANERANEHQLIFLDGPHIGEVWLIPAGAKLDISGSALRTWSP
jgi:mannose-6-phosphate isomerase